MDQELLRQFLIDSNQAGYASGELKKWIKEKDGSTTIPYDAGEWRSHDNFFGGEPYGGRLVVFQLEKPVWMMVYYGLVSHGVDAKPIYVILREALKQMPFEAPFRGPREFKSGNFVYLNSWIGDLEKYSGEEQIFEDGKLVYQANYIGGLVDQRPAI